TPARGARRRLAVRAAPRRGDPVVRARRRRRVLPGLGDASLRPDLAARGPDLAAARGALPARAARGARRRHGGVDGDAALAAPVVRRSACFLPEAGPAPR